MGIYLFNQLAGDSITKSLSLVPMQKGKMTILPPEELEKKRALEFLALSSTEKFYAVMRLMTISYQIRESMRNNPLKPAK